MLVDLHFVSSTQSNVRTAFSGKVGKLPPPTGLAVWIGGSGRNLSALISPKIIGEQGSPQLILCAGQEFEGFGCGYRSREVHGGIQNACCVTGFNHPTRALRKNAT